MPDQQLPVVREFELPTGVRITTPDDLRLMTPFILEERGDWFESEIGFVRHHLRPGMTVVDIGANYGIYTIACAQQVGPEGLVWAYEPGSLPRRCLERSLSANGLGQVRLSDAALSDHCGDARLAVGTNSELNRLSDEGNAFETVPLTTIDAEAARWRRPIDFIKIDAEGEELRIVAGATQFLQDQDPLFMFEYHHEETDNRNLVERLEHLGMTIYRFLPALDCLIPLSVAPSRPCLLNIFACRPSRADQLERSGDLVAMPAPAGSIPCQPSSGRGARWFQSRAWSRAFPHCLASPIRPVLAQALDDAIVAESTEHPAAIRLALKQRSFDALQALVTENLSIPRLFSAARLAMDLAEQELSVSYLSEAIRLIRETGNDLEDTLNEPFLPPDRIHDKLGADGSPRQILSIMADEALLERMTFSIYYAGRKALPVLLRLASNPLRSAATDRRLAAARRILPL